MPAAAKQASVRFTVFTPSFNRAHTLVRPFDSLCAQRFRDFEWLIVDDGSTDGTAELVAQWAARATFPIRYIRQENGGKHRAFNRGVREAAGELFVPLDSDDWCTPDALERFDVHWRSLGEASRGAVSGIVCLCRDEAGQTVGAPFARAPRLGSFLAIQRQGELVGEKWGCHRTEVLREQPFPEFPGERFVPEGLVWNRIARAYQMYFINEALRIYADSADGLMGSILRIRVNSPRGACLYYREAARLPLGLRFRVAAWLNYGRFSAHTKRSLLASVVEAASLLALPACMAGYVLAWRDRKKLAIKDV